jgi:aldehyde:ferredoxin oxidoreductase
MPVYAGKLLRIDLTHRTWREEPIADEAVRKWLLGSGLAAKIYYDEMDPALDPLDPTSPLIVMNGVLAGTFAPTGCRSSWCGRSPLTGIWNEANLAHYWGAELRAAGYDGLIITGRADTPVYLWINQGAVEFRDAAHLWGRDWFEAGDALLAETDPKGQVAGIGIAGERLIKIAGIMCGPSNYVRAAARGGMGALLGSKNLKAIAVRGKVRPEYPDPKRFRDEVRAQNEFIKEHSQPMSNLGTAGGVMGTEKYGDLPIRNWALGNWPEAVNLAGQTFYPKHLVKHTHCYACPIGCGKEIEVKDESYPSPRGEGVEYETLAGFGGSCGVSSFAAVALANSLCNRYGLDTISTAGVIAFAMEAFERGLIGPADTGGVELRFGNTDAMLALIGMIARQEKIGAALAEGVREAARRIGQGSEAFAVHVKGLEVAYHDPRAFVSMAVNYATAARGGCHLESASFWNGYGIPHPDLGYPKPLPLHASDAATVKLCYDFQNYAGVYNPLGLCKFLIKGQVGPERLCAIVNTALGWEWTTQDVLDTGDRIFQLKRLINLRLGVTAADDRLPPRFAAEPRPTGGAAGVLPDMAVMLPLYYEMRGWGPDGAPSPERLARLGVI